MRLHVEGGPLDGKVYPLDGLAIFGQSTEIDLFGVDLEKRLDGDYTLDWYKLQRHGHDLDKTLRRMVIIDALLG